MGATDSKLAFRKGVFRLFEENNLPAEADEYWSQFWNLPESSDDVFSLIGASDIRRVRDSSRHNMETLIDKLLGKMEALIHSKDFTTNHRSTIQLLNCMRVLTRLMPYVFENPDSGEWENEFFWTPRQIEIPTPAANNMEGQVHTAFGEQPPDQKIQQQYKTVEPRGQKFLTLVLQALFLADFTIPGSLATGTSHVNYVIWETGVGSSTPLGSSKEHDVNRYETLRLLIVLLSKSMYIAPSVVISEQDNWIHFVVAKSERKVVLALLCSLLNTAAKYNPLGWGLPYNHVVFSDPREVLVVMCLRAALILLDYQSPGHAEFGDAPRENDLQKDTARLSLDIQSAPETKDKAAAELESPATLTTITQPAPQEHAADNAFRYYLSKLHRPQDFQFLIDGMYRILSNPMLANNTYLPGSTKQVRCHVETMMLCWKLLEINQRFRQYLLETDRVLDLMVVLIYYAVNNRNNPAQIGLVRMSAFVLQTLSSDRAFGVKLNKTFDGHSSLPNSVRLPAFHGSYADFVIISIYNLIATTRGALSTLYPALILIIANVSPYLKNLSVTSSSKLVSLFNSFTAPGFLLADDSNHRLVEYILESFNNIIQYQFTDNPNVIYALIRAHSKFEKLRDFTLAGALQDITRIELAKEEKRRKSQQMPGETHESTDTTRVAQAESTAPSLESSEQTADQQALSEKARGKRKEEDPSAASDAAPETAVPAVNEPPAVATVVSDPSEHLRRQSSASSIMSQTLAPGNRSRFTPTQAWVDSWQPTLPITPILLMLDNLVPQVTELCSSHSLTSDAQVLEYLRKVTLVGILPHPQPIHIRRFQWGEALVIWFRSMLWGQAYVFSLSGSGLWNGTNIKLFQIKHEVAPTKPDATKRSEPASPQLPLEQHQLIPTRTNPTITTETTD
ncbi:high-temperature-induced dauer-formation protein-domain-containing protein [Umbelopsis sp. AD052]|nr:high-temperature-induced dauer-formation protein-domain-containing protein [Umbelopsis sp. AD052]